MSATTHLRALQALELAIRHGSLRAAAEELGITPAAVGQRIRALEDYLGLDLLVRGRSGLRPTPELEPALDDLKAGFAAVGRVSETLNFQRVTEIHVVAERDLYELWLMPRLPRFQEEHPHILFSINGSGDVPMRLGAPDVRIEYDAHEAGETLFTDIHAPACSPDIVRRLADYDAVNEMEGMPLLHVAPRTDNASRPDWRDWFAHFGLRETGAERGPQYRHTSLAIEAAKQDVGFVICGMAMIADDLATGALQLPYGSSRRLPAPWPYRMRLRDGAETRPQIARFIHWLRAEAAATTRWLEDQAA